MVSAECLIRNGLKNIVHWSQIHGCLSDVVLKEHNISRGFTTRTREGLDYYFNTEVMSGCVIVKVKVFQWQGGARVKTKDWSRHTDHRHRETTRLYSKYSTVLYSVKSSTGTAILTNCLCLCLCLSVCFQKKPKGNEQKWVLTNRYYSSLNESIQKQLHQIQLVFKRMNTTMVNYRTVRFALSTEMKVCSECSPTVVRLKSHCKETTVRLQ